MAVRAGPLSGACDVYPSSAVSMPAGVMDVGISEVEFLLGGRSPGKHW
jgi:hypothetical protein